MSNSTDKVGANIVMDVDHLHVHDRQLLYSYEYQAALANAATIDMFVKVDAEFETHQRIIVKSGGDAKLTIEKYSVAPTSPTAQFTVFMRKYQKDATAAAKTKIYGGVTGGTKAEVFDTLIPGGTGGNAIGGSGGNEAELILEEGFWYRIFVTNVAGTSKKVSLESEFYELSENKNSDGNYRNTALDAL